MHKTALALITFALFPALISFGVVPFFGVLDIEGISPVVYGYFAAFYSPLILSTLGFTIVARKSSMRDVAMGSRLNLYLLVALSALYVGVSAYDIARNHDILTLGISGSWKASAATGPRNSVPGAIVMLLSGAPTFLFCAALFNDGSWGRKRPLMALATMMLGSSIICMLLLSSRNSAFISLLFICIVLFLKALRSYREFPQISFNRIAMTLACVMASFSILMGFSLWIFVDRAIVTHGSIDVAMDVLFLDYKVRPTVEIPVSEAGKSIFYAMSQLEFYITHSAGYFSEYLSRDYCPAGAGATSFYGASRIIDFAVGTDLVQTAVGRMISPGVYLSLPGSLYLDFCETGMVVGWLMGLATVVAVYTVFCEDPSAMFLAAFLLCTFTFAPFYSVPSTGNGFSLMMFAIASTATRVLTFGHKVRNEQRKIST